MLNTMLLWLRNKVFCQGNNRIVILGAVRVRQCNISLKGTGCSLTLSAGVNLKGVNIEIDGINCHVSIGCNSVFGENTYLSCRERDIELAIGEGCMFSRNIKIMTSDGHDIIKNSMRVNQAKSIKIGNRVWLADGVVVLKGVEIGNDSVIGIHSVVTKNIEKNTVAVGCPAREISKEIRWDKSLTY